MESKKKILIIENQSTQFGEIVTLLDGEGYRSFPEEDTFKDYLDWIRIYLNPRYTLDRRNKFFKKILDKAIEYNPDIFIIDHILVGTHDAMNGIDLAIKFRDSGIMQPIIFFSRTEMNNIEVCEQLPKVTLEKTWIYKGYSGSDILDEKFFKKEVIPKIEALLIKSIRTRVIKVLNDNIINSNSSSTDLDEEIRLNTRKIISNINDDQLICTEDLFNEVNKSSNKYDYNETLKKILSP